MNITMKELVKAGYDPLSASQIMNEICRMTPHEMISKFVEIQIKGVTTTQYQKLRSVSLEAMIEVCNRKIGNPRSRTAIERWKSIRQTLLAIQNDTEKIDEKQSFQLDQKEK